MTEARIDDLLDGLVPPFEPRPDGWDDVLARARGTRRRYVLAAAAAAALLIVPTAVALRGEITNLTGLDDPYEAPEQPDVVIPTHELTLAESVEKLWQALH